MLQPGMSSNDTMFAGEAGPSIHAELRRQISTVLTERGDGIMADTIAIFPFTGTDALDSDYCRHLGQLLIQLLAIAVRDSRLNPRGGFVTDLHRIILERALPMERLFTLAYLVERTALDELSLDETIGATREPWPLVAPLVRRASFDLLGAYAERAQLAPAEAAVIDRLTTLHTHVVLQAVMAKEVERAGRFGYPISLILFDIDRLSSINQEHGYGVGDKILERLGILMRQYFRTHDWVARHSEDSIAVLLTRTEAANVSELAERVRATVEKRMGFTDHKTDQPVTVTVSAAVVNLQVAVGDVIDPDLVLAEAEAAVERAKKKGRNRVEHVNNFSARRDAPPGA
jgi:diguanylate cyclase (GGDEF)-like protein